MVVEVSRKADPGTADCKMGQKALCGTTCKPPLGVFSANIAHFSTDILFMLASMIQALGPSFMIPFDFAS